MARATRASKRLAQPTTVDKDEIEGEQDAKNGRSTTHEFLALETIIPVGRSATDGLDDLPDTCQHPKIGELDLNSCGDESGHSSVVRNSQIQAPIHGDQGLREDAEDLQDQKVVPRLVGTEDSLDADTDRASRLGSVFEDETASKTDGVPLDEEIPTVDGLSEDERISRPDDNGSRDESSILDSSEDDFSHSSRADAADGSPTGNTFQESPSAADNLQENRLVADEGLLPDIEQTQAVPSQRPACFRQYRKIRSLCGHVRAVSCVKLSPDGRLVASGSADATIKIWLIETGGLLETLRGHLAGISTVSWAPDSRTVASGSDDKTIRLWDVVKGKQYRNPLKGHANYVYSIAFSPKGNILVSGSYDEAVMLWDVRTRQALRTLPAHSDPVGGVDFVWDGTLVVSCASDGLIRIWDTSTGQCLRTLVHEDNAAVTSVCFSPNGRYVCAWTLDSSIRLWDYVDGRCIKTYQGHRNAKYSLAGGFGIYGDSDLAEERRAFIVSGSENGDLMWWDVVDKRVLGIASGHDGVVLSVDCDRKPGGVIVSGGLDNTVHVWSPLETSMDL